MQAQSSVGLYHLPGLNGSSESICHFCVCVCVCVYIEETKENPELVLLCERFVKVLLTVLCITTTHLHTTSSYALPRGGR